ncbi:type II CAAX prenyl endopeptidase Rce1 family protein [Georgenia yuyongxinii]|uniref:CPBP family intramembrane metalloprotease n=1 Tax=Georgenia yuyongxinii TaxID=2589797 RepID=A0A552WT89_9MICO|nr:CPBP family glutamic-type intramembrane protease [Georgenia yuyongxinii]TRW46060.1 CPBP family intramembrane metalloprotease [Georgenia yuyongxinii]
MNTLRTASPVTRTVAAHPVASAATALVGLTWVTHLGALAAGLPPEAALLVELLLFVVVPIGAAAVIGGRAEVRRLLAGLLRWRIGVGWWLLVLVALPVLTAAVALATGTYTGPADGWTTEIVRYLVLGVLVLGVLGNLAEETAWGGFVQRRLMDRHGFFAGSLLAAVPFALIHLPLAFDEHGLTGTSWRDVAITWAVLVAVAPVMRLLLGSVFLGTGGSILAIGLLHASFNASGNLSVLGGGWWQNAVALVVLTAAVLAGRRVRGRRDDRIARDLVATGHGAVSGR